VAGDQPPLSIGPDGESDLTCQPGDKDLMEPLHLFMPRFYRGRPPAPPAVLGYPPRSQHAMLVSRQCPVALPGTPIRGFTRRSAAARVGPVARARHPGQRQSVGRPSLIDVTLLHSRGPGLETQSPVTTSAETY
jgi:hypothetical protein